ncbi:hypothetical protein ACQP2F_01000 [Actinoplanes sp. CA-030573]|uniref:hypothetical protein n=1 Tax=Actinoplanes sp. CA-030573 TaxID=3239898 RepID=UPI003D8B1D2E
MRNSARGLRIAAAAAVGLATAAAGFNTAAHATPYGSNLPVTAWTYTDSGQPDAPALNPTGDMPVGTFDDGTGIRHTRRAYFTYDISGLAGRVPHQVNLYTSETSVESCDVQAPVEIYRTRPVNATTTWHKAPAELELVRRATLGKGVYCPGAYVGTDVTAQIEAALARHEKTLSFEVRIAASAEKDAEVARTFRPLTLFVQSNAVPGVSSPQVAYASGTACGTLAKHPTAVHPQLSVKVSDADENDYDSVTFAVWPVDQPGQRTTYQSRAGSDGRAAASTTLSDYADGTVVGWQAQAADDQDTSAWSRICYLTVDKTPPATKPIVTSTRYAPSTDGVGTGGEGVPGTFVLDAAGDRDTVAFALSDDFYAKVPARVTTNHPGGKARVTVTPRYGGSDTLHVTAIDGAGNRGATTDYAYVVRRTGPYAQITVNGVGVDSPVKLTAASGLTVTSYTYLLEDGYGVPIPGEDEVRVAATGNTAVATIVFPRAGYFSLRIRAFNGKKLVGEQTQQVSVSDAPDVSSDVFGWDRDQPYGTSGSFTFRPRENGVVAYVYDFGDGKQKRIDAAADGTAVLDWTAETGGYYNLTVSSVREDGATSTATQYPFTITDPRPTVTTDINTDADPRTDGVGVPFTVYFALDRWDPFHFVYSIDGGPEQDATPGDWSTSIQVTPAHSGPMTIAVRAQFDDGTTTPTRTVTIDVLDAPFVAATSPYGGTPVVGLTDTLAFTPGRSGVASYRYTVNGGDIRAAAAGADGTAKATFTPADNGLVDLMVSSVAADGTVSTARHYQFVPVTQDIGVTSQYGADTWAGVDVGGDLTFTSTVDKGVSAYVWQVDGGPAVTTPADATGAGVAGFRPTHEGDNTLNVRARYEDGTLSPVREWHIYVGSAPEVTIGECTAGQPVTFTMHGGLSHVDSFHYAVEGGDGLITDGTVTADSTATAQVTFTPSAGPITIYAFAHAEPGDAGGSVAYQYANCAG